MMAWLRFGCAGLNPGIRTVDTGVTRGVCRWLPRGFIVETTRSAPCIECAPDPINDNLPK